MVAALVGFLSPMLALSIHGGVTTDDPIACYQRSIRKIQSFDATISIVQISSTISNYERGLNTNKLRVLSAETNRDVFANGLGRRIEESGKDGPISMEVIDWKTALSIREPLAEVLNPLLSGLTYLDYLNPYMEQEGLFLSDALNTNDVAISPLGISPFNPKLIGFQLEFRKRKTFQNVYQIWFDSDHGYMVKKCERFLRKIPHFDDSLIPINLMEVKRFIQIHEGTWVPTEASMCNNADDYIMKLDEISSSFNSITSGALFSGKSLPKVNERDDGWKQYLSPSVLAQAVAYDAGMRNMAASGWSHETRWIFLGAMGASTLLLIWYIVRRPKAI
jgi:hypothetical protein